MSELHELADPETHEPLRRASEDELRAIEAAIREGRARRRNGAPAPERLEGAYIGGGGRWVYPDVHGIPSFLIEERIELS